jgi:hypothetical protein
MCFRNFIRVVLLGIVVLAVRDSGIVVASGVGLALVPSAGAAVDLFAWLCLALVLWLKSERLAARLEATEALPQNDACNDLTVRESHVASTVSRAWICFGFFLPPRSKKLLGYDLAEHSADLFAALVEAETRAQEDWLIVRFTIVAVGKVGACAGIAFRRRLLDEFTSLMGLASARGMESPPSTPRDVG